MSETAAPALRIVPGAPPPAALSKSQKKKRRAAHGQGKAEENEFDSPITNGLNSALDSALVDTVPATKGLPLSLVTKPEDIANAAIASETAADLISATSIIPASAKRNSAVVELVNKRHRTLHKKIQRIKEYSSKPTDTLNEDQKKTLATLPALEASSKEVEAVREAIEAHEAEEAANESRRLAEIEAIVKQRIADAVSEARSTAISRTVDLVTLIRELPQLSRSTEGDGAIIAELEAALQERDKSKLETTVGLFIAGQGNYSKLIGILNAHLNPPPRTATPVAEEQPEPEYTRELTPEASAIGGIPPTATMSGSYHFMQESELEPSTPFDEGAEWVEHSDAATAPAAEPPIGIKQTTAEGAIDWAAEDTGDLPPISGLQEHFGASGQATPTADAPTGVEVMGVVNGVATVDVDVGATEDDLDPVAKGSGEDVVVIVVEMIVGVAITVDAQEVNGEVNGGVVVNVVSVAVVRPEERAEEDIVDAFKLMLNDCVESLIDMHPFLLFITAVLSFRHSFVL
ncbi:hypothetical protein FRC17_007763 [Serendipita sp. 399]|nr:hypothetical protein FRC17_007763 [Serendipita sp. 399]